MYCFLHWRAIIPEIEIMSERKRYSIEFPINSSPEFLYNYISTPSGLAAWFADDVNLDGDTFTFIWDGSEEKARMVNKRVNKFVRFSWLDREEENFTFEIQQDELTGDVALIVTDFEEPKEQDAAKMIYEVAIERLRQTIGG